MSYTDEDTRKRELENDDAGVPGDADEVAAQEDAQETDALLSSKKKSDEKIIQVKTAGQRYWYQRWGFTQAEGTHGMLMGLLFALGQIPGTTWANDRVVWTALATIEYGNATRNLFDLFREVKDKCGYGALTADEKTLLKAIDDKVVAGRLQGKKFHEIVSSAAKVTIHFSSGTGALLVDIAEIFDVNVLAEKIAPYFFLTAFSTATANTAKEAWNASKGWNGWWTLLRPARSAVSVPAAKTALYGTATYVVASALAELLPLIGGSKEVTLGVGGGSVGIIMALMAGEKANNKWGLLHQTGRPFKWAANLVRGSKAEEAENIGINADRVPEAPELPVVIDPTSSFSSIVKQVGGNAADIEAGFGEDFVADVVTFDSETLHALEDGGAPVDKVVQDTIISDDSPEPSEHDSDNPYNNSEITPDSMM